jgi:hypothetical protein
VSTIAQRADYFPENEPALKAALDDYLAWLAGQCAEVSAGVRGLKALLLAGGYGRGEGGIFREAENGVPRLYNDLEFYLFAEGVGAGVIGRWIEEGERRFHIEIEFKMLKPAAFEAARPSMFYYDLLNGHRLVAGHQAWIDSLPALLSSASSIPAVEAPRLLVNRGMSLLRCLRWADGGMELPPGFCDRIVSKLRLALADSVLCMEKKYHWSVIERHERLAALHETPPSWPQLIEWHAQGVDFKFHPAHRLCKPGEWKRELGELREAWVRTFLWVESRRLGKKFREPEAYAFQRGRLFAEEPLWQNLARQLRDLRGGTRAPFAWGDHPRAPVWKSLLLLMARGPAPEAVLKASNVLGRSFSSPAELEEFLRVCWKKYP